MDSRVNEYYADCSLPTVREWSFTVWTNLEGLRRYLAAIPSRCWYSDRGCDGEHWCLVVTLEQPAYYQEIVQRIKDCVVTENMMRDIEIVGFPPL